jgi:haloalkane dehalogenase
MDNAALASGPAVLRTPDECFASLPGYDFQPHYLNVPGGALGDLRMHYLDEGPRDGAVVLMLHGNPTWSYLYRHMIKPLTSKNYRVVVPDMIGFGRSDKPASRLEYGYDRFVAWTRSFVEKLDLSGITLVCQDWGGPIGLRVLAECEDRFDAVLATNTLLPNCEPMPRGVDGWPSAAIKTWIEFCRTSSDAQVAEIFAGATAKRPSDAVLAGYDAPFPDARYKAGVLQITCGIPATADAEGLQANRAAWQVLERFQKPFLTAFSDGDPATIGWEPIFQTRVPGAAGQSHQRITGAGHFVQEEQGPALAAVLLEFLERNRQSAK